VQRPTGASEPNAQPGPGSETGTDAFDPYDPDNSTKSDNSTYFEAPKLFNPKDRTAGRSIAPVRTALYGQPASHQRVSNTRVSNTQVTITREQAEKDALGWSSISN
jgi:hypothetical protein